MERSEFLKILGGGALLTCAGCLNSCSSNSVSPSAPFQQMLNNVDFTLDLTTSDNSVLQTPGGAVTKSGVIVVRITASEFVALAAACTHEGTFITYLPSDHIFFCNNHGSKFSLEGVVIQGPATAGLRKFNTTLTGDNLRVFS